LDQGEKTLPVQRIGLTHAVPVDGRGHRTNRTLLLIRARDVLLTESARFFPAGSDRETARQLLDALKIYAAGRWQRVAPARRAHRNMQAPTGCCFGRSSSCTIICRATE
jgi:hypothetical protein